MSFDKERDTEAIDAFYQKFLDFCDEVEIKAVVLKNLASTAEGAMKDEMGKKAIPRVVEFANELIKIVQDGKEPISVKRKSNKEDEDEMQELVRSF